VGASGTWILQPRFGSLLPDRTARTVAKPNPRLWARSTWFTVAAAVNAAIIVWSMRSGGVSARSVEASLVAFKVAVGARHDAIVRAAFALGRWIPSYRWHQLTYHLGQLHRAMAIAGTIWFAVAIGTSATADRVGAATGVAALLLLVAIACTARDAVRHRRHDRFERIHRYGGWAALAIIVVLVVRQALGASGAPLAIAGQPALWLLAGLVVLVVHPWIGASRVPVEVLDVNEQLVVLALPGRRSLGEFVRISRDGKEWHSFAVATCGAEGPGRYCLVIRRAGNWTDRLAVDAERGALQPQLWVRRMRGCGFMYHAQTYRHVLFVATGAGIGPVLPYLLGDHDVRYTCLWIARDHRAAVGAELVDRILGSGSVELIDTSCGRPDVGSRVAEIATGFEAVFVVSNETVRDEVARSCERAGVPWYGPTFDS
jgi:hypothetical protein